MATQKLLGYQRFYHAPKHHFRSALALAAPFLVGASLALSAAVIGTSSTPVPETGRGSNSQISADIQSELRNKGVFSPLAKTVDVKVTDTQVQLQGRVLDYQERERVADVASRTAAGREVKNELRLQDAELQHLENKNIKP